MNQLSQTFFDWEAENKSTLQSLDVGEWHADRDLSRTDSFKQGELIINNIHTWLIPQILKRLSKRKNYY
jgi:hypothetical protein